MTRLFLYSIRTTDGQSLYVEATSGEEAIRKAEIEPGKLKKWYPFPLKALPTPEEKAERDRRFAELRKLQTAKTATGERKIKL